MRAFLDKHRNRSVNSRGSPRVSAATRVPVSNGLSAVVAGTVIAVDVADVPSAAAIVAEAVIADAAVSNAGPAVGAATNRIAAIMAIPATDTPAGRN